MTRTTNIRIGTVNLTVNVGANGKRLFTQEDRQELLKYMKKANLSEQDMAILLNCKPQTIKRWKAGKQKRYYNRQEKTIYGINTKPKRKQYAVSYKVQVVEAFYNRKRNETAKNIADKYGLSIGTLYSWKTLYDKGLLTMDNTIAVSHTPSKVIRSKPNVLVRLIAKLFNLNY